MQIPQDVQTELAKASPSIGAAALTIFGVSLPDVVQIAALVYTMGLIAQQIYRLSRWLKHRHDDEYPPDASC
ncbi:hypothetical protein EAH75_01395 [Rhodanobacter glycinis]|uniref:hypothetical protein n=1 Tax=Rhodanobacter glycinis TaxID=582702 RepID=UPI00112962D7|nr:hypothetical protein [Rhodanobacter glycinis]TPG50179.1 hypothetical protein EAH75_01395 [Rhodanobacter glycinis]